MSRVLLEDVVKVYDRKILAVDHVSFEINDGEFFVLVGPSGCGKSTVMRLIAGLEDATSGKICIGDRIVNEVQPKDRDVAMVFQNYALYPHMTAFDNMAFSLKLRKVPKGEIKTRVQEAARILSIEHLLDRKPRALSGGERQRVAVGRTIVRQPKVFLFDEPLSNLDAKLRVQMRAEIARIHKRLQTTMLYVTHDQVEAMTLGQRIGVMLKGKIQQIADAMTLYQKPVSKFVASFIGSPPMNFLAGNLSVVSVEPLCPLCFNSPGFVIPLAPETSQRVGAHLRARPGREVIAGIRPEDIGILEPGSTGPAFKAQVDVVEPMGSETLVYLRAGSNNLVAKLVTPHYPKHGDTAEFTVNNRKLYLFDVETEQTLA
jgi:multiple sugar transport system ATP-binding protein